MRIPHGLRAALAGQGGAAPATDSDFENVSLLLHGDGTNGAQNNTFTDGSANNFTITRNGNTTQGTFSPFSPTGWSAYFDGTGDYLSLSANSAFNCTGDFTFELWINPFSNSGVSGYQLWYGGASSTTYFGLKNNQYVAQLSNGGELFWTGQPSLNVWTHIALARSGSTIALYVNGTSVGTNTSSAAFCSSADAIQVGAWSGSYNMQGYFSNVRLVKGTALYTSNFTPPTSPLTAITNTSLLTLQDNRFKDNSTNNFTITRNGDTKIEAFSPFNPTAAYSASTHGGSGYFDGSGDYLSVANSNSFAFGTGDFTVEFWLYAFGSSNTHGLVASSTTGSGYWASLIFSGTIYWQSSNGATNLFSASYDKYNQWTHVAFVRNSGTTKLYLNGVQTASAGDSTDYAGTAGNIDIGRDQDNSALLTGHISSLRIVKGTAVYTSAFTPPTAPLTAITNTSLLLNFTNGGIIDNASKNVLETVGNAQINTSVKKFGTGSMYFDGTGDGLIVKSSNAFKFGVGNFTIEWWQYWSSISGFQTAYSDNYISANNILIQTSSGDGKYRVFLNSTNQTFAESTAASTGQWYHYALVRNGTSVILYRDGVSSGSTTVSSALDLGTSTSNIEIAQGSNNYYVNGYIDDLRITRGVARYTANFTPPTAAFPDL